MKILFKKELKENLAKFIIETALLVATAVSLVPYGYRLTSKLNINLINIGWLGNTLSEILPKLKDLNYFIYSQWFGKNLFEFAIFFAIINSVGIIAGETERGTAIFLFSRPISRGKVLFTKLITIFIYTVIPIILSTYLIIPLSKSIPSSINIALINKLLAQSITATSTALLITVVFSIMVNDRVKAGLLSFTIIIGDIILGSLKPLHWINFTNLYVGKFNLYFPAGVVLSGLLTFLAFFLIWRKEV